MYESTYTIDTAAEMLGCQQKKILSEWAKSAINIVLDFGLQDKININSYSAYDSKGNDIRPWNEAVITAPATTDYFPEDLLHPNKEPRIFTYGSQRIRALESGCEDAMLQEVIPTFYKDYALSGFYFDDHYSRAEKKDNDKIMVAHRVLLYGLWCVPYSEFSRLHVQDSFTLNPCAPKPIMSAVTATFAPGTGPRRINAPDKKNLRITESGMAIMRELLAHRTGHQRAQPITAELPGQPKPHGGIERFALEREKILAAALYTAHHYPKDTGKTFKAHAEAIEKHAYLFWKDEPAPDVGRIAKILSDATRTPDEWKILGGNAKSK